MEPVSRREFLASALVLAATGGVPDFSQDRVPGEVVSIRWPVGASRVRLLHELDGHEQSVSPVRVKGLFVKRVEVVLMPSDGRMRPGRHEFFLLCDGRVRIPLGGFGVASFRFGC